MKMETKTQTLTMEEAIAKGYTHFVEEQGDRIINFKKITEQERKWYKDRKYFIVDMQFAKYYTINPKTIKELISEYVGEQDEMADENGHLFNIAAEHDYSKLAEELNEKFKRHKYYEPLDIEVTF